jgi:lysine biosynthesis protein LysW
MEALCPECECRIELHPDEHPVGTIISCPGCETELEISSVHPPRVAYLSSGFGAGPAGAPAQ